VMYSLPAFAIGDEIEATTRVAETSCSTR